ncbi:MAG: glycerol-3-phosphate 1-O-acyltransferase PlsY [Sphaerospermopsis sp. SIO1G2]|nr:glycerol-3-phosphate 1-O-acyltransferase PlsY [Sphaerospermopsis sp. SIO1G2]
MLTLLFIVYLFGSIPFGLIIGNVAGIGDIRRTGSGNIGATNMVRAGGKALGLLTLLLDAMKGILPIWLMIGPDTSPIFCYLIGLAAVIGHCFPIWLRFNGGKGVATGLGVIAATILTIMPDHWWLILIFAGLWCGVFILTRIVSLASLSTFLIYPLVTYYHTDSWITPLLLTLIIIMRHRHNIKRLVNGTEHVFRKRP